MRKTLIAIVGLLVILIAAVLVVPGMIDWNGYKPEIQKAAKDATGRDLRIDGDLSLSILPSPKLSVAGVGLANMAGGSTPEMASLESLDVNVALGPLLSGAIRVTSITLVKPVIVLEKSADGRTNWTFDTGEAAPAGGGTDAGGTGGSGAPAVALDQAVIEDGRLIYRDAATGTEQTVSDVNLTISAAGLQGPFEVDGGVTYQGIPMTLAAAVGALDAGRATSVKLDATGGDGAVKVALSGALDMDGGPAFKGRLDVSAPDLEKAGALASAFGAAPPAGLPASAVSIGADVVGSPAAVTASDLVVTLGESRFQGQVTAALDPRISVEATLTGNRLDLDALLPASSAASAETAPAGGSGTAPVAGGTASPGTTSPGALPTDIDARLDLKIDAVQYQGGTIRNAQIDVSLRDGVGDLRLATAQLPGGTDVTVIGGVEGDGPPVFVGRLEAASDNLRATLDWLKVDLSSVPADRLRKAVVSAAIRASSDEIQVSDWTMELDATKAQGGLTLALRDRPAFGLSIAVDRINVDAYLPQDSAAAGGAAAGSAGGQAGGNGATDANPLAVLDTFDANVDIRVGEATVKGIAISKARIDVLLQGGTLTLRNVGVGDAGGAAAKVTGVLRDAARKPSVDVAFDVTVSDVDRFARLLSTDTPIPAAQLGKVSLTGKAAGDMSDVAVDVRLAAAGGTMDLKGTAKPLTTPPTLDLTYKVQHPDTNRLAAVLSPGALDGVGPLGALTVDGTLRSRDDGRYANNIVAYTGGAEFLLVGNIDPFAATPDVKMKVVLKHPDAVKAIRLAVPDYRPRGGNLGAFETSTLFEGPVDNLSLTETKLSAGPIAITGGGSISSNGPRPAIKLALAANRIAVDPWLPPDQPTPGGAAPAAAPTAGTGSGGSWSREPIDTSGLSAVDADITMDIVAIEYGSYVVDAAKLIATLKDGALNVSKLAGGMFGGTFDMTAALADRATPEAALTIKVREADVRQAAKTAAETDAVSGILTYDTDLKAKGGSEYELVSNLNGTGSFQVRDGTVQGFDLKAFSDRLKELNGATDFLDLSQRALSDGETKFRSLSGTYVVTQGVLRSNDIALDADAAAGKATAVIDLPPRQMDVNALARLSDHPNAPPIGVRLVGPFDNPRQILDVDEMQRYVVQTLGTRALKQIDRSGTVDKIDKLLNGQAPASGAAGTDSGGGGGTAAPQPAQQPKLEDAARGLLKGLLNK